MVVMAEAPVVKVVLRNEGLLAPFELVEVVCYAGEKAFNFRADFREERRLGGLEVGF
jgi:hypothetical protein